MWRDEDWGILGYHGEYTGWTPTDGSNKIAAPTFTIIHKVQLFSLNAYAIPEPWKLLKSGARDGHL